MADPQTQQAQAPQTTQQAQTPQYAGWTELATHWATTRPAPASTATVPIAIQPDLLATIQTAHAAGLNTGMGTPIAYTPVTDPMGAVVQSIYYDQGLRYGLERRLASLTP